MTSTDTSPPGGRRPPQTQLRVDQLRTLALAYFRHQPLEPEQLADLFNSGLVTMTGGWTAAGYEALTMAYKLEDHRLRRVLQAHVEAANEAAKGNLTRTGLRRFRDSLRITLDELSPGHRNPGR